MAFQETTLPTLTAAELDELLDKTFTQLAGDMSAQEGHFSEDRPEIGKAIYSSMTLSDMSTVVTRRDGKDVPVAPEHQDALKAMQESIARTGGQKGRISLTSTFQTDFDQLGRSDENLISGMIHLPQLAERESFKRLRTHAEQFEWLMNFDAKTWKPHESLNAVRNWYAAIELVFVRDALNFGQEFIIGGGGDLTSSLFPELKCMPVES